MTRYELIEFNRLQEENPDCTVAKLTDIDFYVIEKSNGAIRKVVEAKAVGDTLRLNQIMIHDALRKSGIRVEVRYECGSTFISRGL